ncbi:ATP-dependent helicase [Vulgatibacter incomptus]|uniref:DNA 3'-5' helicase n=1 Tax=Vulgatibacter incomptus TaxID=1391653 RepID=A0A0K1PBK8_9BACT|nr:ATP-dependent helicase [Vulgatibacter incomptus]AKU90509.1 ATP-dependent DNA helicase UvrD/PcrA [Vulgatibacter incomptus]
MATRRYQLQTTAPAPTWRIDYAGQLNAEQLAVVEAPRIPLLVIAGAGSGKTRTLIFRLARMLESGIPPEQILLLTFTNRAAQEMLKRAASLVANLPGVDVRRITGGTFHHVGYGILREHGSLLGFDERFGVLDREDQTDLFASCIAELGYAVGQRRFPKADVVAQLHSTAINTQRSLPDVILARRPQFASLTRELVDAAARYIERKHEMNLVDFDDLLLHWRLLLVREPRVRSLLQERYRCILVDEYQDTNRLQGELVDMMAAGHRNLTVVGDDAQSIYSFRGADFSNILEFPARYEECQVHKLTVNYRSSPEILSLANASIACNIRQYPKELVARRQSGGILPAIVPARDAVQQAAFIAQRVLELRDEGIPLKEMAVLYRAHAQSMEIQFELSRRGIPFVIRRGVRFFAQAHIKDVLSFLRFATNPSDELSFKRLVKLFPGIGSGTADGLWRALRREIEGGRLSIADAVMEPSLLEPVPKRSRAGWMGCRELLRELASPLLINAPSQAIDAVLAGGYQAFLESQFVNGDSRIDDLRQLADYALQHPDVGTFLAEVSLLTELSSEEVVEGAEPDEFLTLSTIHQAKGLEWRGVFVAWLADGSFPSAPALRDRAGEEEERRCFYVAVTRAKDELYLTYPMLSAPRDGERVLMKPSRFLDELPAAGGHELYEKWSLDEVPLAPALPAPPSRAELAAHGRRLLGDGADEGAADLRLGDAGFEPAAPAGLPTGAAVGEGAVSDDEEDWDPSADA